MRFLALLLPVVLLAGCSGVRVEGLTRSDAPREPHFEEARDLVAPQHDRVYAVPVEPGATLVNVTLLLEPRTSGVGLPGVPETTVPAQLTLEVLDPDGRVVAADKVDPSEPYTVLLLQAPAPEGEWTARVVGTGASGRVDGQDYGASYVLTVEVLYS